MPAILEAQGLEVPAERAAGGGDGLRAILTLPESQDPVLRSIIERALKQSPRVMDQNLRVLIDDAAVLQAKSLTYPRVYAFFEAQARQEVREDLPGTNNAFKTFYGLEARQPVFYWNSLRNQVRIAEIQRLISLDSIEDARRAMVLEIRQQYLGLVVRQLEFRQAQDAQKRGEKRQSVNDEQAGRGEISAQVQADLRLAVDQGKIALVRAERSLARAQTDFVLLTGIKDFDFTTLPTTVPAAPLEIEALRPAGAEVSRASAGAPPALLARAQREKEAAELAYKVQKVRLLPRLDLTAGLTQEEVSYSANVGNKVGVEARYVGVRVSWDIFDGFSTRAGKRRTQAELRQKEMALERVATAASRQVREQWDDLELAQQELYLLEANFVRSQARLKDDEPRRTAGDISEDSWAQRVFNLEQQRIALVRSRGQQQLRAAEYALLVQRSQLPSSQIQFP